MEAFVYSLCFPATFATTSLDRPRILHTRKLYAIKFPLVEHKPSLYCCADAKIPSTEEAISKLQTKREHRARSYRKASIRPSKAQRRRLHQLLPKYTIPFPKTANGAPAPFCWKDIFGRTAPQGVTLEIGSGNGEAVLAIAKDNPKRDYVAVEIYKPSVANMLQSLENSTLDSQGVISNVKVVQFDALALLKSFIPDNSLQQVFIFFPDPFPGQHEKNRRLVRTYLVDLLGQKMVQGADWFIVTDDKTYAETIHQVMSTPIARQHFSGSELSDKLPWRPCTKYERKAFEEGRTKIYEFMYTRQILY